MIEINKYYKKLEISIGIKRLEHSIRVMETALKISRGYDINEDKVKIAALLHDCGRLDSKTIYKKCNEYNLKLDKYMISNINLIHGPLGAEIAKKEYDINDIDVLNSIKYHTTGRENMSLLEKIVFISDYIEPKRNFETVNQIRELAFSDLDYSILLSMNNTIKYVIDKGEVIHLDTIDARNYLLKNITHNRRS